MWHLLKKQQNAVVVGVTPRPEKRKCDLSNDHKNSDETVFCHAVIFPSSILLK